MILLEVLKETLSLEALSRGRIRVKHVIATVPKTNTFRFEHEFVVMAYTERSSSCLQDV